MVLVIPHTFKEHVTSRAVYFDFSSAIRILNFSFVRFDLAYLGKEFGHLWFGYRVLNIKGQSRGGKWVRVFGIIRGSYLHTPCLAAYYSTFVWEEINIFAIVVNVILK